MPVFSLLNLGNLLTGDLVEKGKLILIALIVGLCIGLLGGFKLGGNYARKG